MLTARAATGWARHELAARLAALVPPGAGVAVWAEPRRDSDVPALLVAPGRAGYRTVPDRTLPVGCHEVWNLEVIALVPREALDALDQLDALADLVRSVVDGWPEASWQGVLSAMTPDRLADVPVYRANVAVRVVATWP